MRGIIEIFNLSKNFDNKNILKNINLKIFKGDSLVIIGKSGSGKSLLMKCVLGILKPSQGKILIKNIFESKKSLQNSESLMKRHICLPCHQNMTKEQGDFVVSTVIETCMSFEE